MTIDDLAQLIAQSFQAEREYNDQRFDAIDNRFNHIEDRFDRLESRVGHLEQRFGRLEQRFDRFEKDNTRQHKRFAQQLAVICSRLDLIETDLSHVRKLGY